MLDQMAPQPVVVTIRSLQPVSRHRLHQHVDPIPFKIDAQLQQVLRWGTASTMVFLSEYIRLEYKREPNEHSGSNMEKYEKYQDTILRIRCDMSIHVNSLGARARAHTHTIVVSCGFKP